MSHVLFAHPFACSLAPHLVLAQHDIPTEIRWVPRGAGRQVPDPALASVHPRRKVPALVLPDGIVLTELIVVLMHLEERHGVAQSAHAKRQMLTWLSFLATELHQGVLAPAFDPAAPPEAGVDVRARLLPPVLSHAAAGLTDPAAPIGGAVPTAADALLLWAVLLLHASGPETLPPALAAFRRTMLGHAWVRAVLAREQQARAA